MNYQFTVQINEEHIKYASQKFFYKKILKATLLVALSIVLILLAFTSNQQWDWSIGLPVVMIIFTAFFLFSLYSRLTQKRLSLFRKHGGKIDYEFSENSFKSHSGWATLETKWDVFKAIWIYPKVWMLWSGDIGYFTFPVEQVGEDIKKFLKQKIVSVGGKIE